MLQFLPKPLFMDWDDFGFPLQGGKLYSYVAGTDIPKDLFHDADGTTPWTNPIVFDARGEAGESGIYGSGVYKLKCHDKDDVLKWTMDNIRLDWGTDISNIWEWLQYIINNLSGRPKPFPFLGRGDLRPIHILDGSSPAYFHVQSCVCEAEGGTKIRYPNVAPYSTAGYPDYMLFDVLTTTEGYGTHIVPRHEFTFPQNAPCVFRWFPAAFDVSHLPPLDIPED